MPDDFKKTAEELITLAQLEPALGIVCVEGPSDKAFIERFFKDTSQREVAVYEAGELSIEEVFEGPCELEGGNRGIIIFLAAYLEENLEATERVCRFIADTDLDGFLGHAAEATVLVYTDFACLDSYFASSDLLERLFEVYFQKPVNQAQIDSLFGALKAIFAIRVVKSALELDVAMIDIGRLVTVRAAIFEFDQETYIDRLLESSGHAERKEEFKERFRNILAEMDGDVRHYVHGKDLRDVLALYARRRNVSNQQCHPETIKRLLRLLPTYDQLCEHEMFRNLRAFAALA